MSFFPSPEGCYISTGNSSTTNLAVGNSYTFTGTAEQTNHPDVMVTLKADQVTAISLQFSHDGTNWDSQIPKIGDTNVNEFTTAVKGNRYFRVVVTTASLTTTTFRLQTQFGQFRQGNLSLNSTCSLDSDATVVRPSDFNLEVARSLRGSTIGVSKFGRAPAAVQTTATDIWSRALTQQIWVPPTQARIHQIKSTSTDDDGSPTGIGAATVTVYGLTSWTAAESSETVTLNGTTNVPTANSYVIIHRMVAAASATTTAVGINVGTITATADTDTTITAIISIGQGQTQMAIYAVPSIQTFYLKRFFASINDATAATRVDVELRVNDNPNTQRLGFRNARDLQLSNQGSSALSINLDIPAKFAGPCLIKVQGIASAANVDMSAGFDGYLVTN